MIEIGTALSDQRMFAPFFRGPSWNGWKAVLRAAFAEPMTKAETAFFRTLAQRDPPAQRVREFWCISGRRSGKDSVASAIAAHVGASFEGRGRLRPGERASVLCLAVDRAQAQIIHGYTRAYFERIPALAALVTRAMADGFELSNGVDIIIATNDYRAVRGRTVLCAILDEVSYWRSETSASPDTELLRAIQPGLLTLPEAMLIGITTAYRRTGLAYDKWAKHFGRADSGKILVIHAESQQLNPTLDPAEIAAAMSDDPAAARSDYLSVWRDDLSTYVPRDLIEHAVDRGVIVRAPDPRHRYVSFVDASSGMGDAFAGAVVHKERDLIILDALVEVQPPFDTAQATYTVATALRSYGLHDTMGDDYAKGWVIREFARHGIRFEPRPSGMDRSALYLETLPAFSAARVRLLDNPKLVAQFCALERRVMPGGRDRVDHPNRAGHRDDLANACAGAIWRASAKPEPMRISERAMQRAHERPARGTMARLPASRRNVPWFF
jgi:hypothetical protein